MFRPVLLGLLLVLLESVCQSSIATCLIIVQQLQLAGTFGAFSSAEFPALDALRPQVSSSVQESAVIQLLRRVVPDHADQFEIKIQSSDHLPQGSAIISRSTDGKRIKIVGNSGVDAATAIQVHPFIFLYYFSLHRILFFTLAVPP